MLSRGNAKGRAAVLSIIEHALGQVNSFDLVNRLTRLGEDNTLTIGPLSYDLNRINDIFLVGGGKQVTYAAAALENILNGRIGEGVVVEKRGMGRKLGRIRVIEGGHPLPDEGSVEGAKEIIRIAREVKQDDLVLVCVTGGCTSLTLSPPQGINLQEVRLVSELLLESGAPLESMNTVRKHLSEIGGGKLASLLGQAEVVALIAIDETQGLPWGPTVPDTTTFADAKGVLERYDLWQRTPQSIRDYFEQAEPQNETPKSIDFENAGARVHNIIFAENRMLCEAAENKAKDLGIEACILTTRLEGEAKDVGVVLASVANEIERNHRPLRPPCVVIAGGETTVTIRGDHGEGGRNQELALAAALKIAGSHRTVLASLGTDGTDGPTEIAGAIVDGYTMDAAEKHGIDLFELLKIHDSSRVFRALGDALYTSDSGTNLMDLVIVYIS